jgi:hypothetical protein
MSSTSSRIWTSRAGTILDALEDADRVAVEQAMAYPEGIPPGA